MKTINLKYVVALMALLFPVAVQAQSVRETIRMNEGWKFAFGHAADAAKDFGCATEYFNYLTKANSIHNEGPYSKKFDDTQWQDIQLPHDWVTTLGFDDKASHSHGYKTVGYRYPEHSVGWYRKQFSIPKEDLGKHIILRFDGIFRNATVWFNGFYMGTEPSGYATQVFDVTDYVNYGGDNLICVRADASLEEGWFYEGAGIYRDVWLEKSALQHVAPFGTFVYAELQPPYQSARIHVETEVANSALTAANLEIRHQLLDAQGQEVAQTSAQSISLQAKQTGKNHQAMTLQNPNLWSPDCPYLYKMVTTVSAEGKVVDQYTTTTGIRDIAFDANRGFLLNGQPLKLKGVNMHQDHAGVGAAIPEALWEWRIRQLKSFGCNAYRSSHNPMTPALLDICDREGILVIDENRLMGINDEHLRLLERMIKRDRNHPSIILWSDGNEEWGLENNEQGVRVAASMRTFTHLMDPTRPSTVANAGGSQLIKSLDVVGYNYIVQNDVENRRREHPEWKIVGTEETTGCGTRGIYFNNSQQTGQMPSMNYRQSPNNKHPYENVIERGWKFYADHDWASGIFYWTGFDYRGEPNPLKYPAVISEFGILDYCGFWKDEAWYLKSWWTDEPTLHIFPHWNLRGHEGEPVEVWAYSNCDEVELSVNGRSLGRKAMPRNGHLKWEAVYQPGNLKAVGYKNGKKLLTQTIETTGKAARLQLTADRRKIKADGRDVSVVTVSLLDTKGRVVPDACPTLTLRLQGEGHILGVGNGNPSWLGSDHPVSGDCHEFQVTAFNGYAQVLVQSIKTAGQLSLECSSEGLKPAVVHLETL
ncbi:MAG: DUF4982 domain-containing protein [Prevotella sp.]|nr:DUF4982 domain-containing protein [Prevotella sp.]